MTETLLCPCGSGRNYNECCEPFIKGAKLPVTAEELMRSRYSAYAKIEIAYIVDTTYKNQRNKMREEDIRLWAETSQFEKLEIIGTEKGGAQDSDGNVEFIAHYTQKGAKNKHHEIARFKKEDGKWLFEDGDSVAPVQFVHEVPKIGRNDPCPCKSGKKFKKCCGK